MQVLEEVCVRPEPGEGLEQFLVPPQNEVLQESFA